MFVWAVIFATFAIPLRTSTACCSGACSARSCCAAIFIIAGVALIGGFWWLLLVFGVFLVYTGARCSATVRTKARTGTTAR